MLLVLFRSLAVPLSGLCTGGSHYSQRERILCLMSSDVLRHIRDKLYETLNTNLREKLVGCKTVYFGLVHLCRGDPCQDLGRKLNLEIWCPSGLKICILFSSKVKIYINVSKCSLYVFTIIPPRLTDQCNFITVL